MAEVAMESTPQKVRDLFNKGFAAMERGNLDYAIDLFSNVLAIEPAALKARRFLRAAQIQKRKAGKIGAVAQAMIMAKALPLMANTAAQIKGRKADKALELAEKLLAHDPLNPQFALMAAEAAILNDLPEAAILTLEMVREQLPNNFKVLRRLAEIYTDTGDTKTSRDCWERLSQMRPNDPELVKAFKDSMAIHTMARDGWEQAAASGGTFRDAMKNTEEAVRLEQDAKAVKSERDVDDLIAETLSKVQAEPDNMNYFRSLARLYTQKLQFEEAIATMEEALQRSPGDPELDQMLSSIRVQQMDHEIRQLREAGDEEGAQNREQEKAQFMMTDLEERVKRYPNDLRLKYDLAVVMYEAGRTNEAIQLFQSAQRSPKHRTRALHHLGLCFKQKAQYDMASQQLMAAVADIPGMDGTKKEILYELGTIAELTGNKDQALQYFKEIYQADIGYRDVSIKVENMYKG
ncbi:MAG: tetratricopeptide repeat protein [Lentisphaerae bacterium]|nr:tetratricopeptide repeat protein [Lentisphaerota bacterium]